MQAVHSLSGLHAVVSHKSSIQKAEWVYIRTTIVPDIAGINQLLQPLIYKSCPETLLLGIVKSPF
jgi:hypothetical protein